MVQVKREPPKHFRGKPRPGRRVELHYRIVEAHETGPEQVAYTRNIGIGGAFIVTADPAPAGSKISVELGVPMESGTPRKIVVRGEVRWICDGEEDPIHGMGVKFSGLAVDEVLALNDYFGSITEIADIDDGG